MIVTKTPLRISFFGGGSDLPDFCKKHTGVCVSSTINSYIYLAVNKCVANHLKIVYSELELELSIDEIKHDRVREVLKHYNQFSNIEMCSFSDIPTKGTGLGSSSTFTVGLINAIHNIVNQREINKHVLAELACYIEINKCGQPIGKQDQYAAAYGGLKAYWFDSNHVEVQPIDIHYEDVMKLNDNLLCFNTGVSRLAESVLSEQVQNLKDKPSTINDTKMIATLASDSIKLLQQRKIDEFGELLDEGWRIKKRLSSNVSNPEIDEMYDRAVNCGALGGKILGAGNGGYLLLYVPEKHRHSVRNELRDYQEFKFSFDYLGSTVEMVS